MRRATRIAGLVVWASVALACGDDVRIGNLPPEVTAVGPAWRSGDTVVLQVTTYDREGDDIDLAVFAVRGEQATALEAAAFSPPTLSGVANERDEHTTHTLVWDFGASGVGDTEEISLRVQPAGADDGAVELGPFTVASLQAPPPLPAPAEGSGDGSGEGSGEGSGLSRDGRARAIHSDR